MQRRTGNEDKCITIERYEDKIATKIVTKILQKKNYIKYITNERESP